jgi:RecB family exonuclease
MNGAAEARIVIARGALAAEGYLLGELRALAEAARADWSLLAKPVRVLVPSRSLRDHLAARLVRELGGGAAGIAIQTLRALAHELLERAGEGVRGGQTLVPVLVRRFAAEEPALAEALAGFDDGFSVALATVNDLLDAGLDASNAESALDCVAEAFPPAAPAVSRRAEALIRVAERVRAELAKCGLEPRAGFFRRAREALERAPSLLPSRALFLHGWADVTGVQLDLIEALVRAQGGRVVLDHPPDPADPAAPAVAADPSDPGPGPAWTERLRVRLGGGERTFEAESAAAALEGVEAAGTHAEARAVAVRIRALLDRGEAPESIGIVLREPAPYRHALHAQLGRLGIPFSGGAGSLGPPGRRVAALLELLERVEACPADRWLDARQRSGRDHSADLRLAFHGIGVGRLRDVAELDLPGLLGEKTAYALPVRRGIRVSASAEPAGGGEADAGAEPEREAGPSVSVERRTVSRRALARASAAAADTLAKLAALRAAPRLGAQLRALRALLATLGWRPAEGDAAAGDVYGALARLEAELGGDVELTADELGVVLGRLLGELGSEPLGGRGAGVALLSALESRGRSFARLFVMGLNRDVFPRLVLEDPLLPDALRRALEAVLPDVPVKQRAEHEERHLFAALCAAAPCVTLSWLATSDDGKERPASPLVEALRGRLAPESAPTLLGDVSGPRPAFEHALLAGIAGDRGRSADALAHALGSEALARARREAVEKLDVGGWPERLGPLFGFVGAPRKGDPRTRELAVTRLEGMAYCAWRSFLERVLGLEPPPDALAELPDATPLLVGNVVHGVLERIVAAAGGAVKVSLEDALAHGPVRVAWPEPAALDAFAHEAAAEAARDEGIVLPGFARLLVRRARPLLERIRALDFAGGGPAVLGAEVHGALEVARLGGGTRRLAFRADRADLLDGGVALVDYKTGAPISTAKKASTRTEHLLAQITRGRRLQGPAYALAGEQAREGRYLFAKESVDDENARVTIARDDEAVRVAFADASRDLLAAFELGAFPPKLIGAKRAGRARACESCDVAEACLQGETGSRRHLAAWLARHDAAPERLPPPARAAHALLVRTEETAS